MFLVASVCLFVCLWTILLTKLPMYWDEILWRGLGLYNKELSKLWW